MRIALPAVSAFLLFILSITGASCAPDDADRCGDGFRWDSDQSTCFKLAPAGGGKDAGANASDGGAADDAGVETGGSDAPQATPEGLGDVCTEGGSQCEGLEADYCAVQPGDPDGYCTVQGCSSSPDDCPEGYKCCAFSNFAASYPDFCITDEMYGMMGPMCTL